MESSRVLKLFPDRVSMLFFSLFSRSILCETEILTSSSFFCIVRLWFCSKVLQKSHSPLNSTPHPSGLNPLRALRNSQAHHRSERHRAKKSAPTTGGNGKEYYLFIFSLFPNQLTFQTEGRMVGGSVRNIKPLYDGYEYVRGIWCGATCSLVRM